MPWPTSERITAEAVRLDPLLHGVGDVAEAVARAGTARRASKSAPRVVASSFLATGVTLPIGSVMAASATQPSSITPMSTERTSPRDSS